MNNREIAEQIAEKIILASSDHPSPICLVLPMKDHEGNYRGLGQVFPIRRDDMDTEQLEWEADQIKKMVIAAVLKVLEGETDG